MSLGQRIKQLRKQRGLSQSQLARMTGVNQSLIARLEIDGAVGSAHVASIANILKVNALWLQTGSGKPDLNQVSKNKFEEEINQLIKLLASTDERGREKILTAAKDALDAHKAWQHSLPKRAAEVDEIAVIANRLGQEMLANI